MHVGAMNRLEAPLGLKASSSPWSQRHGCQPAAALALPPLSHLLCIPDYQHLHSIADQQEYINSGLRRPLRQVVCAVVSVYLPVF